MMELQSNTLVYKFPEIHPNAEFRITFQRTLRIPDDGKTYPLPPSLASFPLRKIDDFADKLPASSTKRGGVIMPMYQSEAMWISFYSKNIPGHWQRYPFAVKIATGKRCAISGKKWKRKLRQSPQDYVVIPEQPWLDGFVVKKGVIRQFVAMPLGNGYTAEEQITGEAEHGGLQITVTPMKWDAFERHFPKKSRNDQYYYGPNVFYCMKAREETMGLAPGGKMKQEIYKDPYDINDWQVGTNSSCFVELCNSTTWSSITGEAPPHQPPTAAAYTKAGLPWFDYYDESQSAVEASTILPKLKSVQQLGNDKGELVLPENESASPTNVIDLPKGLKSQTITEGKF